MILRIIHETYHALLARCKIQSTSRAVKLLIKIYRHVNSSGRRILLISAHLDFVELPVALLSRHMRLHAGSDALFYRATSTSSFFMRFV